MSVDETIDMALNGSPAQRRAAVQELYRLDRVLGHADFCARKFFAASECTCVRSEILATLVEVEGEV